MKQKRDGALMLTTHILIVCASRSFAQDIQHKILIHNTSQVMISKNEEELKTHIKNLKPILVLIEACLRMNITAYLIGRIYDNYPKLRFAVLSYTELDSDSMVVFLNSGAASFINFRLDAEEYMKGLAMILSGSNYIPEDMKNKTVHSKLVPLSKVTLTRQEIETITLLVNGYKLPKVAATLGITEGTVRIHRKHAYAKCGVHNLIELAKFVYATKD
jgi:DNA-binding NarL/FixJ family response regulator